MRFLIACAVLLLLGTSACACGRSLIRIRPDQKDLMTFSTGRVLTRDREAPERTASRLRAREVCVVVRRGGVRASPHFYNDESEIDRLVESL